MANIPTQKENPNGLHQRYQIRKVVKIEPEFMGLPLKEQWTTAPVDDDAEYFVLRLDTGGSDINHIKACRIAIHAYADAIESHIPGLAKDLCERYPLLNSDKNDEVSDTTMLNQGDGLCNKKIEWLREKFFNEIIEPHPHSLLSTWKEELFEWFKPYLQGTIDLEGLEKELKGAVNDIDKIRILAARMTNSELLDIKMYELTNRIFACMTHVDGLKTNLPNYLK